MGGQFLSNKDRVVNFSRLYQIALRMPKGCHLHLHFNAELAPEILVQEARRQPNMFIRSTQPLLKDEDYDTTEIVFNVMPIDTPTVDIWSPNYKPEFKSADARPWMKWTTFQDEFKKRRNPDRNDPETWIRSKMVLHEDEVYGQTQTTNG
jgi:adenosine deaminase CECR1